MNSNSAISVAKTILHECIHAYLSLKYYGCNQGANLGSMDDVELSELLHVNNLECAPQQDEHEFMFNFMIPTMSEILNDLIPQNQQTYAEEEMFIHETNPLTDLNGEFIKDTPWDWNQFYKYLCMPGLHNSAAFHLKIGDPINNDSAQYKNFLSYIFTGTNSFNHNCTN